MTSVIFSKGFSLSDNDKVSIVQCCWPDASNTNVDDYKSYFGFFHQELRNIPFKLELSPKFAVQTLEDIKTAVKVLSENRAQPRSYIIKELRGYFANQDDSSIIRSMELVVRLWLNLNVQTWGYPVPSEMPRITRLQWADNISLVDLAGQFFRRSQNDPDKQRSRISPGFTAWKLKYLCDVTIEWTDSLTDHLHFDPKSKILRIYQHKICLLGHWYSTISTPTDPAEHKVNDEEAISHPSRSSIDQNFWLKAGESHEEHLLRVKTAGEGKRRMSISNANPPPGRGLNKEAYSITNEKAGRSVRLWRLFMVQYILTLYSHPLPKDLLEETMRTLDLLFPFTGDEDSHHFLISEKQSFHQILTPAQLGQSRALDFSEFKYWRHHLEDLHDIFTSPPRSKRQLLRDRRNKRDFWTLMISITALALALILGIFGLVNAMISNRQTEKSLHLAQRSFDLALAQACSRHDLVHKICP
jgi:hypothetical protein